MHSKMKRERGNNTNREKKRKEWKRRRHIQNALFSFSLPSVVEGCEDLHQLQVETELLGITEEDPEEDTSRISISCLDVLWTVIHKHDRLVLFLPVVPLPEPVGSLSLSVMFLRDGLEERKRDRTVGRHGDQVS